MFLNLARPRGAGHRRAGRARPTALKAELIAQLSGLRDDETGEVAITRGVRHRASSTAGPYLENAPDLLIGYNAGYRASWDGATGVVAGAGLRGQRQGLERRPLHRSAAGAGRALLQPHDRHARIRRWSTSRRPSLRAVRPRRRPAHMDGKPLFDSRRSPARNVPGATRRREGRRVGDAGRPPPRRRRCAVAAAAAQPRCSAAVRARKAPRARHRARLRRHGLRAGAAADGRGPPAEPVAAGRAGHASQPLGTVDAAAEPGRLVELHHRPGRGRPRHLRLRPPRPEDA